MNKEQVLKIVSETFDLVDGTRKLSSEEQSDFLSQLSLALDKEEPQAMKDFARSIVEQSVPGIERVEDCTCTHTHGEHGSHTEVVEIPWYDEDQSEFLQFICLDDGVIYKELEITREGK